MHVVGYPPCLFRPPYGGYTRTTLALTAARTLTVWRWSVDPEDWKANGSASSYWVQRIITRAEAGVRLNHPVILFHNGAGAGNAATVAALPAVIAFYRAHGYAFVDLLGRRGFAPYAPTGAPAPAVAVTAAGLHVFTRGGDGRVRARTLRNGTWSDVTSLGGGSAQGPAAARTSRTVVLVAIVDSARRVAVRSVGDHSAGAWVRLAGSVTGRPAVTADPATGTVTIAARDSSGAVQYRQRVAGRWGPWTSLGGQFASAPTVVATRDAGLTVAAVTAAGGLRIRHRGLTGWGPWLRVGGLTVTADPALTTTSDGRHLLVVARDAQGGIQTRLGSLSGGSWGPWHSLGGVAASGPAATPRGASLAVVATDTNGSARLDVAASGATATRWSGWRPVPG